MTCIKITESQNGQFYPEDTFSHGAAHFLFAKVQCQVAFRSTLLLDKHVSKVTSRIRLVINREISRIVILPMLFSLIFADV